MLQIFQISFDLHGAMKNAENFYIRIVDDKVRNTKGAEENLSDLAIDDSFVSLPDSRVGAK